ncbi:ADP-ribosylglycohydrolase family protein [Myxococcus sp. AM001]|nr:ADP-ribosylglycohydrolase family protein [Myxococcus sp. AM001]
MLLELAVGDAYGAGFEYVSAERVLRDNDLSRYVEHPRPLLAPGSYTDDTQMSLAVAEAMLSGEPWTPQLLARYFVATFRRDPRKGYSRRFQVLLEQVETGEEFLDRINPSSDRSGAAMRAPPLGVLPSSGQVIVSVQVGWAVEEGAGQQPTVGLALADAAWGMGHGVSWPRSTPRMRALRSSSVKSRS